MYFAFIKLFFVRVKTIILTQTKGFLFFVKK